MENKLRKHGNFVGDTACAFEATHFQLFGHSSCVPEPVKSAKALSQLLEKLQLMDYSWLPFTTLPALPDIMVSFKFQLLGLGNTEPS